MADGLGRSAPLTIDLNGDIGESFGIYDTGTDEVLLQSITSGNIACGFHAGDPSVMRQTVRRALAAGVGIGAHPGFPDLVGFGRREMNVSPHDVADMVLYQVGALAAIARVEGATVRHVKPHGALYNMSVRRRDIAEAIAGAVLSLDPALLLVGLPASELLSAGSRLGLQVAAEGFADRSYEPDGSLTPRQVKGSVISDHSLAASRAVMMARDGRITARDGSELAVSIDTICVHSDTPDAAGLAAAVRRELDRAGIVVESLRT